MTIQNNIKFYCNNKAINIETILTIITILSFIVTIKQFSIPWSETRAALRVRLTIGIIPMFSGPIPVALVVLNAAAGGPARAAAAGGGGRHTSSGPAGGGPGPRPLPAGSVQIMGPL